MTQAMLDAALSAAERESLSHLEFLHRLLAGPADARKQRAIDRRIRAARFRELTSLEGFDWEFNAKGIDRRAIEQLATCDFVRRRENVVLVGQSGLGKSRILQAIGRAACVLGYNVRYAPSAKLLQEFTAAMADGSYARMLAAYARLDLLLIDEFGFDRLEREAQAQASTVYYRLLDARTGRRSTALATNIDFKAWADYLGDPPLATAFLDRLVDGAVPKSVNEGLAGDSRGLLFSGAVLSDSATARSDPSRPSTNLRSPQGLAYTAVIDGLTQTSPESASCGRPTRT